MRIVMTRSTCLSTDHNPYRLELWWKNRKRPVILKLTITEAQDLYGVLGMAVTCPVCDIVVEAKGIGWNE